MLNFEEQVKLGISLLKWNIDVKELKTVNLSNEGVSAAYIYEPIRGGMSIIVDEKGEALYGTSALSLEQLLQLFKQGERTNFADEGQCNSIDSLTDFINNRVFTIESKKDPSWESTCREYAGEAVANLAKQGASAQSILDTLSGLNNINAIEEFLVSQQIQLPTAERTKESLLTTFNDKLQNIKKYR